MISKRDKKVSTSEKIEPKLEMKFHPANTSGKYGMVRFITFHLILDIKILYCVERHRDQLIVLRVAPFLFQYLWVRVVHLSHDDGNCMRTYIALDVETAPRLFLMYS